MARKKMNKSSLEEAYFKNFANRSKEEYMLICKELDNLSTAQVFMLAYEVSNKFEELKKKHGHCRHKETRKLKVKNEIIWEYYHIRKNGKKEE